MFGSFGAGFGSFGAGVGGLLPSFTNITSWLKTPTADGKTLDNSKGVDATLTGVNCLDFDGSGDRVKVGSAGGVDLTEDIPNVFGSCVITATFRQDVAGTQVIHSVGGSSYRLFTALGNFRVNASSTNVFPVETGKVYRTTLTYNSSGQVTNFVLENLTDGTTQTDSTTRPAGLHGGSDGWQIGTRNTGLVWNGKISNVSVSNSSVGANVHLPLAEGSGSVAYDVSGNGANGNIIGTTWATLDGIESWNHQYGFDTDIFKGYAGYWDLANSALGTWTVNESNLTLTGNTGSSSRIRQVVDGLSSGDTLVVSGTIVQTGGAGGGADVAISSSSAGWVEGSVLLGGQVGTYTFSTTLNANSSNCDIQFIAINAANIVISDLKFTVVRKIPALNFKTKQVATFDGVADHIDLSSGFTLGTSWEVETTLATSGSGSGDGRPFGMVEGNNVFQFESGNSQAMNTLFRDSSGNQVSSSITPSDRSDFNTYKVVRDGNSLTYFINGSQVDTDDASSLGNIVIANPIIGARSGDANFFSGSFKTWKLTISGSVAVEYDFQSDIGTTTVQDLSANNNDGTITVGSGGTATFWGTRVADTAGSIVSADYAVGNTTITNPLGFVHNGSECGVAMVTNSLTSTQLFAIDNSTATETFVRKDNGNIVQILDYSAPLTGDDLARTRSYVG